MSTKNKTSISESHLKTAREAIKDARWFDAERAALASLDSAMEAGLHALAADATDALWDARHQRVLMAIDVANGSPQVIDQVDSELESVDPGVFLLVPYAVAADARRMRFVAMQTEVPMVAVCREPLTMSGQVPIVAIGEVTIRCYVDPPEDPDSHSLKWIMDALDSLGDSAIERLDPTITDAQRIVALRNAVDSIPEHQKLHEALADAFRTGAA
tara:strand:+ start:95 stop:739 length:645 start_codon:yes stop_codon:yes gene_type:complete